MPARGRPRALPARNRGDHPHRRSAHAQRDSGGAGFAGMNAPWPAPLRLRQAPTPGSSEHELERELHTARIARGKSGLQSSSPTLSRRRNPPVLALAEEPRPRVRPRESVPDMQDRNRVALDREQNPVHMRLAAIGQVPYLKWEIGIFGRTTPEWLQRRVPIPALSQPEMPYFRRISVRNSAAGRVRPALTSS